MAQEKKKTDPENVFVTPGKQDTSKVYVFVPFNYRDAQAALKEIGATWAGSQWQVDGAAFKAGEAAVREAAKKDIALGVEGRKAREDALKAEKPAKAAKAEKADKPKAEKKELTDEEKAAKAAAKREELKAKDATRVLVAAGGAADLKKVEVSGAEVDVTRVSATFALDEKTLERISETWPDNGFKVGDEVAYAEFAAPEAEKEVETDGPGM